MPSKRLMLLVTSALVTVASCGGPDIDIRKALEISDLTTGWYDAGIENGMNKLVPTVGFRLKNVADAPVTNVQLNALFRRVGETEDWGTSFTRVIGREGLSPGAATDKVVLRSNLGYTGTDPRADMLKNSEFKDVHVRVFAKHGGQQWARLGEWNIDRTLITKESRQ